jgi:hypothetical protein
MQDWIGGGGNASHTAAQVSDWQKRVAAAQGFRQLLYTIDPQYP